MICDGLLYDVTLYQCNDIIEYSIRYDMTRYDMLWYDMCDCDRVGIPVSTSAYVWRYGYWYGMAWYTVVCYGSHVL